MNKASVYDYVINLNGDYRTLFHEVERIALEAICLLSDKQEEELVEILKDYDIEITPEEEDKVLYTFFTEPNKKCMVMQGATNGKFIARWNVDKEDYTEEFSTLEKAMKWLTNEGLTAEEVEGEE